LGNPSTTPASPPHEPTASVAPPARCCATRLPPQPWPPSLSRPASCSGARLGEPRAVQPVSAHARQRSRPASSPELAVTPHWPPGSPVERGSLGNPSTTPASPPPEPTSSVAQPARCRVTRLPPQPWPPSLPRPASCSGARLGEPPTASPVSAHARQRSRLASSPELAVTPHWPPGSPVERGSLGNPSTTPVSPPHEPTASVAQPARCRVTRLPPQPWPPSLPRPASCSGARLG